MLIKDCLGNCEICSKPLAKNTQSNKIICINRNCINFLK